MTRSRARLFRLAGAVSLLAIAGCSGTSTDLSSAKSLLAPPGEGTAGGPAPANGTVATAPPAAAQAAASSSTQPQTVPASDEQKITSFKAKTVVLFKGPLSRDGERVEASTFSFPIAARSVQGSDRIEVMTINGPRWVARSEVNLMPAPPSPQAAADPN